MKFNIKSIIRIIAVMILLFCANIDVKATDITNPGTGGEAGHDCNNYLFRNYNESTHWMECNQCHKHYNEAPHNLQKTGDEDCGTFVPNGRVCNDCGYSYTIPDTHVPDTSQWICFENTATHCRKCQKCGYFIENTYEKCKDASGNILGCKNGIEGTCSTCGHYINNQHGLLTATLNDIPSGSTYKDYVGLVRCDKCMGTVGHVQSWKANWINDHYVSIDFSIYIDNELKGSSYSQPYLYEYVHNIDYQQVSIRLESENNQSSHIWNGNITLNINENVPSTWTKFYIERFTELPNGYTDDKVRVDFWIPSEIVAPTISSVDKYTVSGSGDWATLREYEIKGYEKNSATVTVQLKDSNGQVISSGTSNYSVKISPDLEAPSSGRNFKISAIDAVGNTTEIDYTIYKQDSKAPEWSTFPSVNTNGWSRTKLISGNATDYGIGQVQFNFNDKDNASAWKSLSGSLPNYSLNNLECTVRDGVVIGAEGRTVAIYLRDGLGNTRTDYMTIYYLDTEKPKVTYGGYKMSGNKAVVSLSGSDGVGSGVVSYGYSTSTNTSTITWSTSPNVNISTSGNYYFFTKDGAGNISDPTAVKSIQLSYTIKFSSNAGTDPVTGSISDITVTPGSNVKLPNGGYTRKYYKLIGWSKNNGRNSVDYALGADVKDIASPGTTITLYAVWQVNYYTINFNNNGGTGSITSLKVENGTAVTLPPYTPSTGIFSKVGYIWKGYSRTSGKNNTVAYWNGDTVYSDIGTAGSTVTLYAYYTPIHYTITWDANNSKLAGKTYNSATNYLYDTEYSAPTQEQTGFNIKGYYIKYWSDKKDGSGRRYYCNSKWPAGSNSINAKFSNLTAVENDKLTLYAIWEPIRYYIRYNANTGSGSMTNSTHIYDNSSIYTGNKQTKLSTNKFTKTGSTFIAWNTKPDGTGTEYVDDASILNLTDVDESIIDLYAQWIRIETSQLTLSSDNGSNVYMKPGTKDYFINSNYTGNYIVNYNASVDSTINEKWQMDLAKLVFSDSSTLTDTIKINPVSVKSGRFQQTNGISRTTSGSCLVKINTSSNPIVYRNSNNRELEVQEKFTVTSSIDGKKTIITPGAELTFNSHVFATAKALDDSHAITITGDGMKPVIGGLDVIKELKDSLIDREIHNITLNIGATDPNGAGGQPGSGVKSITLKIKNKDNGLERTFENTDPSKKIGIDITVDDEIFSGDLEVTVTATDNVGNSVTEVVNVTEFDLDVHLEKLTNPEANDFLAGEYGVLNLTAWGYPDRMEVIFPDELRSTGAVPEYTFNYKSLSESEKKYRYDEEVVFIIPLSAPEKTYDIEIKLYKGDKELSQHQRLNTISINGIITEQIKTDVNN